MEGNVQEEVLKANTPGRKALAAVLGGAVAPAAYRYAVEGVVRLAFGRLSAGDYQTLLMACAPDVEHTFSGDHALGGTRPARRPSGAGSSACTGCFRDWTSRSRGCWCAAGRGGRWR